MWSSFITQGIISQHCRSGSHTLLGSATPELVTLGSSSFKCTTILEGLEVFMAVWLWLRFSGTWSIVTAFPAFQRNIMIYLQRYRKRWRMSGQRWKRKYADRYSVTSSRQDGRVSRVHQGRVAGTQLILIALLEVLWNWRTTRLRSL